MPSVITVISDCYLLIKTCVMTKQQFAATFGVYKVVLSERYNLAIVECCSHKHVFNLAKKWRCEGSSSQFHNKYATGHVVAMETS